MEFGHCFDCGTKNSLEIKSAILESLVDCGHLTFKQQICLYIKNMGAAVHKK